MNSTSLSQKKLKVESVVELAREVAGAQAPTGRLVVRENLGPGLVREVSLGGEVRVYWPSAALETWVATEDLDLAVPQARLIAIYRCVTGGHRTLDRCKVIKDKGLSYNWTVELLPDNIIRTVRSDGLAWTFDWHPVVERAHPHGTIMEDALAEDEHAEALTVAELATP
jgi:hypothetical protein